MRRSLTKRLSPAAALWLFPLTAVALASPTCGTDQNPSCGLSLVLHWLFVAAVVLSILLGILVIFVVRYYLRTRRATLDDAE